MIVLIIFDILVQAVSLDQIIMVLIQIYKLKAEGDDFKVKRLLATYYLKENGDTDSCTFSIDRNTYIGISLPEDFENITYDIYYKDIPFFLKGSCIMGVIISYTLNFFL